MTNSKRRNGHLHTIAALAIMAAASLLIDGYSSSLPGDCLVPGVQEFDPDFHPSMVEEEMNELEMRSC